MKEVSRDQGWQQFGTDGAADAWPSVLTPREVGGRDTRHERIRDRSLPPDCLLKRDALLRPGIRSP